MGERTGRRKRKCFASPVVGPFQLDQSVVYYNSKIMPQGGWEFGVMGDMQKRIKLANRQLPDYSKGEEIMNMVTHITGGGLGVVALVLCVVRAALQGRGSGCGGGDHLWGQPHWTVHHVQCLPRSAARHGEKGPPGAGPLYHLFFLIAGSYTPVALSAIRPLYPELGIGLAIGEWALTALAVTLTAIDLRKYRVFSMVCYIGMGWAVFALRPTGHGGHGTDRVYAAFGWRNCLHPGLHSVRHWREEEMASLRVSYLRGFWAVCCTFLPFSCMPCKLGQP